MRRLRTGSVAATLALAAAVARYFCKQLAVRDE
jgi:hypothetical protein